MPHTHFNARFTTLVPAVSEASATGRTYFTLTETETIAKQLRDFKASLAFVSFRKEYEDLLNSLNRWCINHHIQQWLNPDDNVDDVVDKEDIDEDDNVPSFELFQSRLLDEDYYDTRAGLFFNAGKKLLEHLLVLLGNPNIPLASKKNALINLQMGIGVCADGTMTNIVDAANDLNAFLGVDAQIENTKRVLIQQLALAYIKKTHRETGVNEIHYVNTYYNHVAERYGLPQKSDGMVAAGVTHPNLLSFASSLEQQLTPEIVLRHLINEMNKELLTLREKLSKEFFTDLTQRAYTKELEEKTNSLVQGWNQRYAALISLDPHTLILLSEECTGPELQCSLAPHNEAWVHANVVAGFRELFLSPESQRITFKINKNISLYCANGIFWIEKKGECLFCSPELFARVVYPEDMQAGLAQKTYFITLKKLMIQFPENPLLIDTLRRSNCFDLLRHGAYFLFKYMLTNDLITPEILMSLSGTGSNVGKNIIWDLVMRQQYSLLEQMLDKNLLTYPMLNVAPVAGENIGKNSIWKLVSDEQFALLDKIIAKNLLTRETLLTVPHEGIDAGKNSFWLLLADFSDSADERTHLAEQLIAKNLITQNILRAAPDDGEDAGKNSIQLLVRARQYGLLENIIKKNLISSDMLNRLTVWKLAINRQFALLEQLLAKDLLTAEQLSFAPTKGNNAGRSILKLLADHQQLALLQQLLAKKLLTKKQFGELTAKTDEIAKTAPQRGKRSRFEFFAGNTPAAGEEVIQEPPLSTRRIIVRESTSMEL